MIREIQDKIIALKKEKNICLVAHTYQASEILEVADIKGDSFVLSQKAQLAPESTVVLAGVRFMAEGVKLLSPDKKVILAHPDAGCPMAEQIAPERVRQYKKEHPDHPIVAYINTTAELKAVCDVCVTSSTAVKIVSRLPEKEMLFIPDCNLGDYVQRQLPDKKINLWLGGCHVHAGVTERDVINARKDHPGALLLVHPECVPEVVAHADFVGSTSAILEFAAQSDANEFIIGTEMSISEHLTYQFPDKHFHMLSKKLVCPNMKITSLMDVYRAIAGTGGEEIILSDELMRDARRPIDKMIELGQ
ncbi:MAG: quinolinate synthase NadA [Eubacteriales bacterium]|nr:quinolinate synthase NadA [Eubacteriales bacterium]